MKRVFVNRLVPLIVLAALVLPVNCLAAGASGETGGEKTELFVPAREHLKSIGDEPAVIISSDFAEVGGQLTVEVFVRNIEGLGAALIDIDYNSEVLEFEGAAVKGNLEPVMCFGVYKDGELSVELYADERLDPGFNQYASPREAITFKVLSKGDTGLSCTLKQADYYESSEIDSVELITRFASETSYYGTELPLLGSAPSEIGRECDNSLVVLNKSVKVKDLLAAYSVEGAVLCDMYGNTLSTDALVPSNAVMLSYYLGRVADYTYFVLPGDVNCDGAVTSDDARFLLRCSIGLEPEKAYFGTFLFSVAAGSVRPGTSEARDILRYAVGLAPLPDFLASRRDVEFSVVKDVRVNARSPFDSLGISAFIARSREELVTVYSENPRYGTGLPNTPALEPPAEYDEAFFGDKCLIVLYSGFSSGSMSKSVEKLTVNRYDAELEVKTNIPQAGTCDLAWYVTLIEVSRESLGDVLRIEVNNVIDRKYY